MQPKRCDWVSNDEIYQDYHDNVWGRPVVDGKELFAKLCLDGQQAGLSWITILKKQQNYERLFFNFDPQQIVVMSDADLQLRLQDPGIIRNRLKVYSIVKNAKAFLAMESAGINFSDFIWSFTDGKTVVNEWRSMDQVPVTSPSSDAMAKALKKAGFSFVGSTICYAFMQAVGIVNDHTTDCHCYQEVRELARR